MKRLIFGIYFLIAVFAGCAFCESNEWPEYVLPLRSGDFEYKILDDGTAQIIEYRGHSDSVTVPNSLDGYDVIHLNLDAFYSVKKVKINKNIIDILPVKGSLERMCSSTEAYNVSSENTNYKSIDGVIFNKDGSILICYPPFKNTKKYNVPSEVKIINDYALLHAIALREIIFPEGLTEIGKGAFYETTLEFVTIPSSVREIGRNAFDDRTILIVDRDSYAEQYVKQYKIKYIFSLTSSTSEKDNSEIASKDSQKKIRINNNSDANVREKPTQDSSKVGRAYANEIYILLESSSNGWYKIRLSDGKEGWISGKLAEIIQ